MLTRSGTAAERRAASPCPACEGRAQATRLVVQERYRLFKCTSCRTEHLLAIEAEVPSSSYWMHKEFKFEIYASPDVRGDYERRYRLALSLARDCVGPIRSVLDIGCGIGNFIAFAEEQGMRAVGVDIDRGAVQAARDLGLQAFEPGAIDAVVPDGSLDAVTLWDVIEHDADPRSLLADAIRKVRPGGCVLIETPDASFPLRPVARLLRYVSGNRIRVSGRFYYWEHKVYFTVEGLRRLLEREGCELSAVRKLTSPRAKMARLFARDASTGSRNARVLGWLWPILEPAVRRLGTGNKILAVGLIGPRDLNPSVGSAASAPAPPAAGGGMPGSCG